MGPGISEIFTGEFWRLPTRVAMCKQRGRILGWKPQMSTSISKLSSEKARLPPSPQPRTPNSGKDQLFLRYEKPRSTPPLCEYRCFVSAKAVQGNYLHLFCGLQRTLHSFPSPPDSDKNKENREVRILEAPVLAGFCGTRENAESLLFFLSYF